MDISKLLLNPIRRIQLAFSAVIFIIFFYLIFQPFQMAYYEIDDFIFVNAGYFIISLFVLSIHLIVLPHFFKEYFSSFISKRQNRMLLMIWLFLILGISFFLFKVVFGYYDFTLERLITGSLAFGSLLFFPVLLLKFIDYKKVCSLDEKKVVVGAGFGEINLDDINYIYSAKNYVVWVCSVNNKIEKFKNRETLISVQKRLENQKNIIQTHRAFIVNLDKVDHVNKVYGAYQITINNCDEKIPLSRSFYSKVKIILSQNRASRPYRRNY